MGRLGFFHDRSRCSGCRTCQAACKEKNKLASGEFCRRADTVETEMNGEQRWVHISAACSHCEEPDCVKVCPTGAMYKSEDGTVQHRDDLCIACGRCVHNCPYGAPFLDTYTGYARKCDSCIERRKNGQQPACVESCPMRALHFGDIEELEKRIVILGSGAAAVSAVKEIRSRSREVRVTMLSREKRLPYCRPMLSKGLLGSFSMDRYPILDEEWLQEQNVTYMGGVEIVKLDAGNHEIILKDGKKISYDKCIYALGADCFIPPIAGRELPGVFSLRYDSDIHRIRQSLLTAQHAVVIGGGITGLEIAWELKKAGLQVVVLDMMEQLMERILDACSAGFLRMAVEDAGIQVETGICIKEIAGNGRAEQVVLEDGRTFPADFVIVSAGYRPNIALAEAAGLAVSRAVTVNEKMQTSNFDIYACGDCVDRSTATWMQSIVQGTIAGANVLGAEKVYQAETESAIVHTAEISLLVVGDMGKQPGMSYQFVYGHKKTDIGQFYVNPRGKHRRDSHMTFCFLDGYLAGAAMVGSLEGMLDVEKAVKERWNLETLKNHIMEGDLQGCLHWESNSTEEVQETAMEKGEKLCEG